MLRFVRGCGMAVVLFLLTVVPAFAEQPSGVPPDGSGCGAFYGSVVASVARIRALSGEVNPGVLHRGFAGAEEFPGFDCPS